MRTYNKEKILKEGTMREKIKLYFTHIALLNIYEIKDPLLSQDEIMFIYNDIKDRKDIKYYDALRRYSMLFEQMLKPQIEKNRSELEKNQYQLSTLTAEIILNMENKMMELIKLERNIELELNKLMNNLLALYKTAQSYSNVGKLLPKSIMKDIKNYEDKLNKAEKKKENLRWRIEDVEKGKPNRRIISLVEGINNQIDITKTYLEEYKLYVNKLLPLPVYREFLQKEEKMAKETVLIIRERVEMYLRMNEIELPTKPEDDNGAFYVLSWDDLQIDTDEKDLDYYKRLAYE